MKTPGACVGPQLPGRTGSFNLHCLSKRCCCVYSKKSSDSQIQGQGEQGYHSLFEETVFEPTRDNRAYARQQGSFSSAAIFSETAYETGKLNCRENSRCIYIIIFFPTKSTRQDIAFKAGNSNSVKGHTHRRPDYCNLYKIKTFWVWSEGKHVCPFR